MRARRIAFPLALLSAAGALLLAGAPPLGAGPHNWAQWRGPDGLGIAQDTNVPLEWSPTKNVV